VELLEHLDPAFKGEAAKKIATEILTHPLIRDLVGGRLGSTIHREEFITLLMELAADAQSQAATPSTPRTVLINALQNNGIADPGTILDNVRSLALRLEMAQPELATNTRQAMALMQEANSKLVAKVNANFDQTIDRVSQRFTFTTRLITFGCALVVAFGLQVDAIGLINRLSTDTSLRDTLMQQAIRIDQQAPQPNTVIAQLSPQDKRNLQAIARYDLLTLPTNLRTWYDGWDDVNPCGVLLSAVLLSLGAPFWYNALKNLLRLRSLIATKDDEERQARATTQAPATSPTSER
jgi:hypothetical protein